jgi:hypothetical protein
MPPSRFSFPLALFLSTLAVTSVPCLHAPFACLASTPGAHLLGVLFTLEASYFAGRFVSRGPRLWDFSQTTVSSCSRNSAWACFVLRGLSPLQLCVCLPPTRDLLDVPPTSPSLRRNEARECVAAPPRLKLTRTRTPPCAYFSTAWAETPMNVSRSGCLRILGSWLRTFRSRAFT